MKGESKMFILKKQIWLLYMVRDYIQKKIHGFEKENNKKKMFEVYFYILYLRPFKYKQILPMAYIYERVGLVT